MVPGWNGVVKPNIDCWVCGQLGHFGDRCPHGAEAGGGSSWGSCVHGGGGSGGERHGLRVYAEVGGGTKTSVGK